MRTVVIGHFDLKNGTMIGATVKVREIYKQLQISLTDNIIERIDIFGWKKNIMSIVFKIILAFFKADNILLVISDTGFMLMGLLAVLKKIFRRRIWYIAVGGNMGKNLSQDNSSISTLRFIDAFFVENSDCVDDMKKLGYDNVHLMRNFKHIKPITENDIDYPIHEYKFCTFSRVNKDKGISEAINAIEYVSSCFPNKNISLHIYGAVDESYKKEFFELIEKSVHSLYCGVIDSDKSVEALKKYYCMLFPTKFQTEGIPGTIIDAFASGLPVICSNWQRCRQLITEYYDGLVYPFADYSGLVSKIQFAIENPNTVLEMKKNCIEAYQVYRPENAIKPLIDCMVRGKND